MVEINKDNLEKALSLDKKKSPQMSKEMEIGFHQGALNTLVNERNELIKVITQVEQVMQAHLKRLEELGVKIQKGNPKS
jgi:hypothetical protein